MSETSNPKGLTEVEKQEQVNADLRAQTKQLLNERLADEAKASEAVKLRSLKSEESQLKTELEYQQRLRAGRASASTPAVVVQDAVQPPAPDDNKGAKAPASGKDK